jgi:hypothetical protein
MVLVEGADDIADVVLAKTSSKIRPGGRLLAEEQRVDYPARLRDEP